MSDVALIRECAAPAIPGEGVKAQISRAARRLRWAYWRTFNVWYGKAEMSAEERAQARAVMLKRTSDQEVIRHEFKQSLAAIIGVAEAMSRTDPGAYRKEIGVLRSLVGNSCSEDLA